jgi:hypothetical protein
MLRMLVSDHQDDVPGRHASAINLDQMLDTQGAHRVPVWVLRVSRNVEVRGPYSQLTANADDDTTAV